ncbi:hypothetical protein BJX68DRAFT_206747 [Aspergillus pseudodeflectus]|uniref:Uncharacterized protein n=1 Tax=Aspergillus pseudodeflectus TaxID=176178 RepID=A0ABR4KVK7_9EURO
MASILSLRSLMRPYLFLLMIFTSFSPASADMCTFWDSGCVDPLAQTAISFKFPPLFLETINFYYAFDADGRGKGQAPMIKAGYWIGYEAYVNNSVIDLNRTSEIAVRVGNLTGTPSGGNNGCDGVWGPECSKNMQDFFKEHIFRLITGGEYDNPLSMLIESFHAHPPEIKNCPPPFFDVQKLPTDQFAFESEDEQVAVIKKTGSADSPWMTWFIDNMTAGDQAEQVAVGIMSRTPAYGSPLPQNPDGIQVELVCARAPSSGTSVSSVSND